MTDNNAKQIQSKKKMSWVFRYLFSSTGQTFFVLITLGLLLIGIPLTKTLKSENLIIVIAVLSNIIWFTAFAVFPFMYVLKTGKFIEGLLRSWFFNAFVVIIISIVIPGELSAVQPEMAKLIENSFPDSIGVFPVIATGGIPALIICSIAYGIHSHVRKNKPIIPKT